MSIHTSFYSSVHLLD